MLDNKIAIKRKNFKYFFAVPSCCLFFKKDFQTLITVERDNGKYKEGFYKLPLEI